MFGGADLRSFLSRYTWRPLYLFIVGRVLAGIDMHQIESLTQNLEKLTKQRDEIAARIEKIMLFLVSTLLVIFLVIYDVVSDSPGLFGFKISSKIYFIFFFLLVGNLIALLHAGAMLKMFILEGIISFSVDDASNSPDQPISFITSRFFTFSYKFISRQDNSVVQYPIRLIAKIINIVMNIFIPITYMSFYVYVLAVSLKLIWYFPVAADNNLPMPPVELLCGTLLLANAITLFVYAFMFVPIPVKRLEPDELQIALERRAYALWERNGCPNGLHEMHWNLAEKQIRLLGLYPNQSSRQ
jgi:hypothetical protein